MKKPTPKRPLTPAESARAADWFHLVAPVVRSYARKHALPAWLDVETLESHGLVGLMDAARLWTDAGKPENDWRAYAKGRIKAGLIDGLRLEDKKTRTQMRREAAGESVVREVSDPVATDGSSFIASVAGSLEPIDIEIRDELANAKIKLKGRVAWLMESRYLRCVPTKQIAAQLGISENRIQQVWPKVVEIARARINGKRGAALPFSAKTLGKIDAIIRHKARLAAKRRWSKRSYLNPVTRAELNHYHRASEARRRAARQKTAVAVEHARDPSGKSCSCGWAGKRWALHDRWVRRWAENAESP